MWKRADFRAILVSRANAPIGEFKGASWVSDSPLLVCASGFYNKGDCMFTWPSVELTNYERQFVGVYKDGKKPGVLRRTYEVFMNSKADALTPGLEKIKLKGNIQIARRSRVFGLGFAGNLGSWRLQIETASGEQMTPKPAGADGYPIVSSMIAGASWNALAALGDQTTVNGYGNPLWSSFFGNKSQGPLLIDPNWELSPNEVLIFNGTPIDVQVTDEADFTALDLPAQKLLSIAVHVWEFPGMSGEAMEAKGCK